MTTPKELADKAKKLATEPNRYNTLCATIDQLQAMAEAQQGSGEPVAWEVRHWNTNGPAWGVGAWSEWERVQPRNVHTDTVETHLADLRAYIARGLKYELRALYTAPPSAQQATGKFFDRIRELMSTPEGRGMIEQAKGEADTDIAKATGSGQVLTDAVTNEMVEAYLKANDAYWKRTDELPQHPAKWRNGNPKDATRESLRAALATGKREPLTPEKIEEIAKGSRATPLGAVWPHAFAADLQRALGITGEQLEPQAIHCEEAKKPGGCQLPNVHCGWPKCNKPKRVTGEQR